MHELFLSPTAGDGADMPAGTSCVESPTYEQMSDAWKVMVSNRPVVAEAQIPLSKWTVSCWLACAGSKVDV